MKVEIVNSPFQNSLVGKSGQVEGKCYGEKGQELMDSTWSEIRDRGIESHGLNNWVYLPDDRLFTGVELKGYCDDLGSLESMEVSLSRFLRHVHIGPYSDLPKVWDELLKFVEREAEIHVYPSLEDLWSLA